MAEIIASVVAVSGPVFVRDPEGNVRALARGDALRQGDTVLTEQGGRVELASLAGEPLALDEAQAVRISAELSETARPAGDESELAQGSIEQVIRALQRGGQIDELLEAPAAGLGGGSGGEGNDFVRLLRIVEPLTPQDDEFVAGAQAEPEAPLPGRALAESQADTAVAQP